MDTVTPEIRSRIMAAIGRKDTRPEIFVRSALHRLGYRFRIHDRRYPGTPDLVLPRYRTAIFVHGCFWHAHDCREGKAPGTRRRFWRMKFKKNKERDLRKVVALKEAGWRVLMVWECATNGAEKERGRTVERIARWIEGRRTVGEIAGRRNR